MHQPGDSHEGGGPAEARAPLAIACVADSKPKYLIEALRFAHALTLNPEFREFADLYIGVFPDTPRKFVDAYRETGANVVMLGERLRSHGPSNKLLVLDAEILGAYGHVALVDCDILPVKPFPELLDFDGVQAKIADLNTVNCSQLSAVFDLLGVPMPEQRWQTSIDRIATTCYCNTGCIIFSGSLLHQFVSRWRQFNDVLLTNKQMLGKHGYFLDQASFCVCVSTFLEKFRPLPLEMNFPGHFAFDEYPDDTLTVAPKLLHYHDRVDVENGALDLTDLPNVQEIVAAFNAKTAAFRERLVETPAFWQANLTARKGGQKHAGVDALLRCVIADVKPKSISDLGFGGFVPGGLDPAIAYTGVDFAGNAVNLARQKYPQYKFELANIQACREGPKADLVLMMDVLRAEAAESDKLLLQRALALGKRAVLVSVRIPGNDLTRAWHEFLARLDGTAKGFRPVGRAGTELFALRTA